MKLAIVGSRRFLDYELLKQEVDKLDNIECIVSGGAKGADSLGVKYARDNNIRYIEYLPDWDNHGKSAGFIRNKDIIDNCDYIIAFWDGISKGTKHSIDLAKKAGKELIIIEMTQHKNKN